MKTFFTFSIFLSLFSFEAFGKTTKEIWLEFSESSDCLPSFCADDIPVTILENALIYFKENQKIIKNNDFLTIIDFTKLSTEKRMTILNLKDGSIERFLVTHAKKSEGKLGQAKYFSNAPGSKMSSIGFFLIDPLPYIGKHGSSLRLTGLSKTNSNARIRDIVIHAADYATQEFANDRGRLGLSHGCLAIDPEEIEGVVSKMKGESLLYVYSDQPSN
jgi:hypothetical protein